MFECQFSFSTPLRHKYKQSFDLSASNHHFGVRVCGAAQLPRGCCQSKASPPAQTAFLQKSWPISVCPGFFQPEVAIFGQINTLLFWQQRLGSEARMRSPLRAPEQQNNTQQDTTRTQLENKGLQNYCHPLITQSRPEANNQEATCPASWKLMLWKKSPHSQKFMMFLFCDNKEKKRERLPLRADQTCFFQNNDFCLCVALGPQENEAHGF